MIKKTLAFCLTLLFIFSVNAFGLDSEYGLTIAGTVVTSSNKDDILGDGKVKYDPDTSVLTLENANIQGEIAFEGEQITINLVGSNKISGTNGISARFVLIFTGEGNLEIAATGRGINAEGDVEFSHTGQVSITGGDAAIYGWNANVSVKSGTLYAKGASDGETYGIYLENGTYTQLTGIVDISGTKAAILVTGNRNEKLIDIREMVSVVAGGQVVTGKLDEKFWQTLSTATVLGNNAKLEDAAKRVNISRKFNITKKGEHFYLVDKNQKGITSTIAPGETLSFFVIAEDGYTPGKKFYVKVNGKTITPVSGQYTVANVNEDIEIEIGGFIKAGTKEESKIFGIPTKIFVTVIFVIAFIATAIYVVVATSKEEKAKKEKKKKRKA